MLRSDHIQDVPNGRRRVGGVQPGGGQVHPAHKRQDRKLPGDLPWKGNVIWWFPVPWQVVNLHAEPKGGHLQVRERN